MWEVSTLQRTKNCFVECIMKKGKACCWQNSDFLLQHSEQPHTAWRVMPLADTTRSPREHLYSPVCVTYVIWVFSTPNCKSCCYKFGPHIEMMEATTGNPKEDARKQLPHVFEKLVKNCTRMYSLWMALLTKDAMSRSWDASDTE